MLIALALSYLWPVSLNATDQIENDWQYIQHVLLSSEHRQTEKIVTRWTKPPTYWAFVRPNHREIVARIIGEINQVLRPNGFQINLVFERPERFQGFIMIEPEKSFLELQKTAQCDVPGVEFAGFSCTSFLPESGELFNAVIMVLDDSNVDEIKGTLVEEIYQSLGVPNDHDVYRNSINFEDDAGPSINIELGEVDKKTLIFLYKHLEPGDDEATVKEKFDQHWSSILVD